jgi:hypothetical protein
VEWAEPFAESLDGAAWMRNWVARYGGRFSWDEEGDGGGVGGGWTAAGGWPRRRYPRRARVRARRRRGDLERGAASRHAARSGC